MLVCGFGRATILVFSLLVICVVLAILWISGLGFDVCFSVIGLRRLFVFLVASLPGSCWCDLLLVSWVSCSSVWVWVLFWWFGFAGLRSL